MGSVRIYWGRSVMSHGRACMSVLRWLRWFRCIRSPRLRRPITPPVPRRRLAVGLFHHDRAASTTITRDRFRVSLSGSTVTRRIMSVVIGMAWKYLRVVELGRLHGLVVLGL